jgi:hypothetical protein
LRSECTTWVGKQNVLYRPVPFLQASVTCVTLSKLEKHDVGKEAGIVRLKIGDLGAQI